MQCDRCNRQAVVHVTERESAGPRTLHLCEDHARQCLSAPPASGRSAERVTLPLNVSQEQIDRAEQVLVETPDGERIPLKLRRGMFDGWVIEPEPTALANADRYEFRLHVTE